MTRFTVNEHNSKSPIWIAYGSDQITGVFLSVSDKRLEFSEKHSETDQVNTVAMSIGAQDGGGSYFDMHTGSTGYGHQVTEATMRVYLARYDVGKSQIDALFAEVRVSQEKLNKMTRGDFNECVSCLSTSTDNKACAQCHVALYCNRQCQVRDWPVHKTICSLLPFPDKNKSKARSVHAFYLAQDAERIQLVNLMIDHIHDKNTDVIVSYEEPQVERFIGVNADSPDLGMRVVPGKRQQCESLDKFVMLGLVYNRTFENRKDINGSLSVANKMAQKLSGGREWRGPILAVKMQLSQSTGLTAYVDVECKDFADFVEFFKAGDM